MYKFMLDNSKVLYLPGDEECVVSEPEISLTLNEAGYLSFRLPPKNPYYDSLRLRRSIITVYRDDEEIFCGEVRENQKGGDRQRNIYCVGELADLHNSRQPQKYYGQITIGEFLSHLIENHNKQVEARQQFAIGNVSITARNPISFVTDHDDTLETIREQLIDVLGGVLRIRKTGGIRYFDYISLDEYGPVNSQGVTFGENLMDYAEKASANNVVTAIIPRGASIESDSGPANLQEYVSIKTVNGGKDYLVNQSAVATFGYIWSVVDFPDITSPAALKTAGQRYLTDTQYEDLELTLTAADLSQIDSSMEAFDIGDRVPVYAAPYNMNRTIPVKSLTLYPQAPQNERLKLSANLRRKSTYTATAASATAAVASSASAAARQDSASAAAAATAAIADLAASLTGAYGGYRLSEFDEEGQWQRDLYMDAPTATGAQNIMEISPAGIAFSTTGYNGPYITAWSIAGALNASRVRTGILKDAAGKMSWNMDTGDISLSGPVVGTNNGTETGRIDLHAARDGGSAAVISSRGDIYLECGAGGKVHVVQGDSEIGYFDASGWNGPVNAASTE